MIDRTKSHPTHQGSCHGVYRQCHPGHPHYLAVLSILGCKWHRSGHRLSDAGSILSYSGPLLSTLQTPFPLQPFVHGQWQTDVEGGFDHGSTLLLFALINKAAGGGTTGENEIGCYTAGYSIIFVYASSIFASLDNDFFPRLTGILDNLEECRKLVWRQIRLSFTLAIPAMAMLILFLPWLLPMLNTEEFASAIPMAQIASVSLLFRAVYLPLAYLPLAAGDSRTYMLLEIISYIVFFALVYTGYRLDGLFGAGIGMTLSSFVDMCVLLGVVKVKYKI